jgi:hypothetical protein
LLAIGGVVGGSWVMGGYGGGHVWVND